MNNTDTNTRSVLALRRGLVPRRPFTYHQAHRYMQTAPLCVTEGAGQ